MRTRSLRCPECRKRAIRDVAYLRDGRIPERFCYCRGGHCWLVKGGTPWR